MSLARSGSSLDQHAGYAPGTHAAAPRSTPIILSRERGRSALRVLDACLQRLEDDHERGQTIVSRDVASRFGSVVLTLVAGMPIAEALEVVFKEQEKLLQPSLAGSVGLLKDRTASHRDGALQPTLNTPDKHARVSKPFTNAKLTQEEARELTHQIKSGLHQVSVLLLKAHDRKAWAALGYDCWSRYARVEFGLSRSRSYELLEHGRVLQALAAAAGLSGIPDISPYAAAQIKPHLAQIGQEIGSRVAGLSQLEAQNLVEELVAKARAALPRAEPEEPTQEGETARLVPTVHNGVPRVFDAQKFLAAIECLAKMPPVTIVAGLIPQEQASRLAALPIATRWLGEFAELWGMTHASH